MLTVQNFSYSDENKKAFGYHTLCCNALYFHSAEQRVNELSISNPPWHCSLAITAFCDILDGKIDFNRITLDICS